MKLLLLTAALVAPLHASSILVDGAHNDGSATYSGPAYLYSTTNVMIEPGDWINAQTSTGGSWSGDQVVSLRFEDGYWTEAVKPEPGFKIGAGDFLHVRVPTNGTRVTGVALLRDNPETWSAFVNDIAGGFYRQTTGNSDHEATVGMGDDVNDDSPACDDDFDFGSIVGFGIPPKPPIDPVIPEPSSAFLLLLGASLGFLRRR